MRKRHERKAVLILMMGMIGWAAHADAAILHVDANNQTGVENGTALRPYSTVIAAVAAAASGDEIRVARGTYAGPIRVEDRTLTLMGGFAGGSSPDYEGNVAGNFATPNINANQTTLTGVSNNAVVLLINSGASVVDGFIIREGGGAREDAFRTQGGGVYIDGGAVTIRSNIIEDNNSRNPEQESFGGGVYTTNGNTSLIANVIRSNLSGRGAGIAVSGGTVVISFNVVRGNLANGDHGGGIYAYSPNITIAGNQVYDNEVGRDLGYGWGGGIIIFNPGANATLRSNQIFRNFAPSRGSGVFIDEGASALMEHCIIHNNESNPSDGLGGVYVDPSWDGIPSTLTMRHCTVYGHQNADASVGGNGLYVQGNCTALVENSIFWGNDGYSIAAEQTAGLTVRYTTTEEPHAGPGNLTGDPLFADPAGDDFHLRSTAGRRTFSNSEWVFDDVDSPCIDAADPASPFANEPHGNGGRANQGAYGNTNQASRTTLPSTGLATGFIVR